LEIWSVVLLSENDDLRNANVALPNVNDDRQNASVGPQNVNGAPESAIAYSPNENGGQPSASGKESGCGNGSAIANDFCCLIHCMGHRKEKGETSLAN
jgi:hypothetical protein